MRGSGRRPCPPGGCYSSRLEDPPIATKKAKSAPAPAKQAQTAAPAAEPAKKTSSTGYDVSRPAGKCFVTGQPINPGDKYHAALRETPMGMERLDILPAAWPDFPKDNLLADWLATMPHPEQKKKVFVDDEVLLTLFERLSETTEIVKIRFRFVLGLILMRKRLISYESQREEQGDSIWSVKIKGRQEPLDLINPHLSEDLVGEVASQLSEILSSEL